MKLKDAYTDIVLTADQKAALDKLQSFLDSRMEVFLLKGYAGTGKTTLVKGLVAYIHAQGKQVEVMAPTGRAAKILRDKTGYGQTIHRSIYRLKRIEYKPNERNGVEELHYYFPINENPQSNRICIVDESSMIAEKENKHEIYSFGSDRLLPDLLTYMKISSGKNKIIFVGDPAQLPPVGEPVSKALDIEYFAQKGIAADAFEMKDVVRQKEGGLILKNATMIRDLLKSEKRNTLQFAYDDKSVRSIQTEDILDEYVKLNKSPKIGNSVIVCYSNKQAYSFNSTIREHYFPGQQSIQPGDILLINNNNYGTFGVELYNGDMAEVKKVGKTEEVSIDVNDCENTERVKKKVQLSFRAVELKLPHYDKPFECKIHEKLLSSPERDLSINELKALFIYFKIRFDNAQKKRKQEGKSVHKRISEEFTNQLKSDPYYNALRVKYAYAITCHKAQGGEWKSGIVDFSDRSSMNDDSLRWAYTAITRVSESLFLVNAQSHDIFDKLSFSEVGTISKIPTGATVSNVMDEYSPYHDQSAPSCKHEKCLEVLEKIQGSGYQINRVVSKEWHEMYYFTKDGKTVRMDTHHNKTGQFKEFKAAGTNADEELLTLLNAPAKRKAKLSGFEYHPGNNEFGQLYEKVSNACKCCGVSKTNIKEFTEQYYVRYSLITDADYAQIDFFFNKKLCFGLAQVKSLLGREDEKLNCLIQELKKNKP